MSGSETMEGADLFRQRSANFVEWFEQEDGTRRSLKVELADLRSRGAGRVAKQDISENEELFAIPRPLVLAVSTSSIPQDLLEPLQEHGAWLPLIVTIIYEYLKGTDSRWHHYLELLPTKFDTLMFWSPPDLAELQASAVVRKIGRQDAEDSWRGTIVPLMLKHKDLFPIAGSPESARTKQLVELAHRAGSWIMAYAFDIDRDEPDGYARAGDFEEDDEEEPLKGMVPFADMLNADADRNNARLFQEDEYLVMKATKPIKAGEEIFNDYGPLPRSDLLRMYGYVTDNYAKYDVVDFEHDLFIDVAGAEILNDMSAWQKREAQLDELGMIDDGYSVERPSAETKLDDALPDDIRMLLRGLCPDNTEKMPTKIQLEPISIREATLLSAIATKKLSEYATSIQQDRLLLQGMENDTKTNKSPDVSNPRYGMAVQVRLGEKEIIQRLIQLCEGHIREKTSDLAKDTRKRKHDGTKSGLGKPSKQKKP